MGRVYGTTDTGERVLVWIVCDTCGAKMRPGPHVVGSGWMDHGTIEGSEVIRTTDCADCAERTRYG